MYSFKKQLKQGQEAERFLDRYFSRWYAIKPANMREERRGIDRHFTNKRNGNGFTVQYKADKTAARTGNAFVETVSVDRNSTPGWAYSCEADYLVYYIVGPGPLYILRPGAIRRKLGGWSKRYPERVIQNDGYQTVGLLVPLDEFERLAEAVMS